MNSFFKAVSNKTENQSREVWLAISHGLELEILYQSDYSLTLIKSLSLADLSFLIFKIKIEVV